MKARTTLKFAAAATIVPLLAEQALAHHPTGGAMPTTLWHGLLSGIGHPIIGLDHLAFVIGLGLLAAIAGIGLILPALFVLAMMIGLGLHVAGLSLPYAELLLAASVLLIGLTLSREREGSSRPWLEGGAFALTGLLHGYAFAEAVIGAEPTPIAAYIVGLAATQMAIAAGAYWLASEGATAKPAIAPVMVRAAGVAIAAIGIAYLTIGNVMST